MTPSQLTPDQFIAWRKSLGMSQPVVAKRMGLSLSTVYGYEKGTRQEGQVKIPLLVTLGMAAISNNIQPYGGDNANNNNSNSEGPV